MARFLAFAAFLIALLLIGLLLWLMLMQDKPKTPDPVEEPTPATETVTEPTDPPADPPPADLPTAETLASEELSSGLVAEVMQVERGRDGLVEVRWRYRNPTDKAITLCSNDEGRALVEGIYASSGGQKYRPFELAGEKRLVSEIRWTTVPEGKSTLFWAKFAVPAENEHVAFFVPGLMLPMEDLAVAKPAELADPAAADTAAADPAPTPETPAAQPHAKGLMVEVVQVKTTPEGFVEVRWRYRNPTTETIHLFNSDEGGALPSRVMLVADATTEELPIRRDADGVPMASKAGFTTVAGGKSATFFARFEAPAKVGTMTFYVPDTPPLAGLSVQ